MAGMVPLYNLRIKLIWIANENQQPFFPPAYAGNYETEPAYPSAADT